VVAKLKGLLLTPNIDTPLHSRTLFYCRSTSEPHSSGTLVTTDANASVFHVVGILRNAGLTSPKLTRAETTRAEGTRELDGPRSAKLSRAVGGQSGLNAPRNLDMRIFCVRKSLYNHSYPSTPECLGSSSGYLMSLNRLKMTNQLSMFSRRCRRVIPFITGEILLFTSLTSLLLRNIQKREPAVAEVEEYSRLHFEDQMTFRQVSAAFQSGDEVRRHCCFPKMLLLTEVQYCQKLTANGSYCTAYDSQLATIIQRTV
jgi:hypothetical protein